MAMTGTITVHCLEGELADGSEVRALLVLRRLPAPPRLPDVEADLAAARAVCRAHERRGFGRPALRRAESTLRLTPSSEAA